MTKRKLAAMLCKLEGKKSQVAMSNMMEALTVLEGYFATLRVASANPVNVICEAESAMLERITKLAAKVKKKSV